MEFVISHRECKMMDLVNTQTITLSLFLSLSHSISISFFHSHPHTHLLTFQHDFAHPSITFWCPNRWKLHERTRFKTLLWSFLNTNAPTWTRTRTVVCVCVTEHLCKRERERELGCVCWHVFVCSCVGVQACSFFAQLKAAREIFRLQIRHIPEMDVEALPYLVPPFDSCSSRKVAFNCHEWRFSSFAARFMK